MYTNFHIEPKKLVLIPLSRKLLFNDKWTEEQI